MQKSPGQVAAPLWVFFFGGGGGEGTTVMGKCALEVLLLVTACNTWLLSVFQAIQVLGDIIVSKSYLLKKIILWHKEVPRSHKPRQERERRAGEGKENYCYPKALFYFHP